MNVSCVVAVAALLVAVPPQGRARETRIPVGMTSLYAREAGRGQPVIVLHGGPDFDHSYLLPELDRAASAFRLIDYDQRGRGRSAENVRPEDVTLTSDLDDLDRQRTILESPAYEEGDPEVVAARGRSALITPEWSRCRRPELLIL